MKVNKNYLVKRFALTMVVVFMFSLVLSLFFSIKVKCQTIAEQKVLNAYYAEKEQQYVAEVREYLDDCGLNCSGVMLTRVTDDEGHREYTITVHNKKIAYLNRSELEKIEESVEILNFADSNCNFIQKFVID